MSAFQLLHASVQRKLHEMRWTELRPIQAKAIQQILGETPLDCIIASPTASGKTEAAFLPVLSTLAEDWEGGVGAMYIGPLKALINDQFRRIEDLCTRMEIPVHKWHGDVSSVDRKRLLSKPSGVLLITPESLEAMFVLRPMEMPAIFGRLGYVIIDELHSFMGNVRGAQLLSQLHRLRHRTNTDPLRIGLSATLGDPAAAKRWLRNDGRPVRLIEASGDSVDLSIRVRGFWRSAPSENSGSDGTAEDELDTALPELARSVLLSCHGKTNLVFANSKALIESLADALVTEAGKLAISDDIVVHHGSLSRESREHAEARLRDEKPCSAVCSNTLEMGIDIGEIDSVVQVSAPWSVSSLVQRIGRSGRRAGTKRILRGFFIEEVPNEASSVWDGLHLDFIRAVAIVQLMLERFLEPNLADRANLSTLVQQIMSCAAESGGIGAADLFDRTVGSGAFSGIRKQDFAVLLRELGARNLIEQLPDGTLVLGIRGQRIVEHYSFYAAFKAPDAFQILHGTRQIGSLPETSIPPVGEHLLLAGLRWRVSAIEADRKQVYVVPASGKRAPKFQSGMPDVHPRIHRKMRALLMGSEVPLYLDETASAILAKARDAARVIDFRRSLTLVSGGARLSLWAGSRVHRTLGLVFAKAKVPFETSDPAGIDLHCESEKWAGALREFVAAPDATALATHAESKEHARIFDGEKYDTFVPPSLWSAAYGRERLDVPNAVKKARRILQELSELTRVPIGPRNAPGKVAACRSLGDWAQWIASLDTEGPFGACTILVPDERFAHALRSMLVDSTPAKLTGTRFITPLAAATEVLLASGLVFQAGESNLRPLRLQRWIHSGALPSTCKASESSSRGWAREFSCAINDLEAAGLRPDALSSSGSFLDLSEIWRGLDSEAGTSWTSPRVLYEAAVILESQQQLWPFDGPTLAIGHADTSAVEARFLLACPNLELGVAAARPLRRHAADRITALYGANALQSVVASAPSLGPLQTELSLLQHYLFEAPDRLASPDRTRSRGPDGTVSLESYAAVSDEVDAVVTWIVQEIIEYETPAQDIAVLSPESEPWHTLIADRLNEVTHAPQIYFERGQPVMTTMAGLRVVATLRAIADFLPADTVTALLPKLRLQGSDDPLSLGRARNLVSQLPTAGGGQARPSDALMWAELLKRESQSQPDVYALLPAIEALVDVTRLVISNASLVEIWNSFRDFAILYLIAGPDLSRLLNELEAYVFEIVRVATHATGSVAVELILERLLSLRSQPTRFGLPAVYIGTIAGSAGLPFAAVRIVGLAEGAFPRIQRARVALPDAACRKLSPLISTPDTAVVSDLHAFDAVIRETQRRLCLSYSRRDLDGSEREPSALFVEVSAALARPNALTGAASASVPNLGDIERDAFSISRTEAQRRRSEAPRTDYAWLLRRANGRRDVPKQWLASPLTGPIPAQVWPALINGMLGPEPLRVPIPGLDTPISASGLKSLLRCPHRFLQERVLRFSALDPAKPRFRIAPAAYGTLLHRIAEVFYTAHGTSFGKREATLPFWIERATEIADREFTEWMARYYFANDAGRSVERFRLLRDTRMLIDLDWGDGKPQGFVAVERSFGTDAPLSIPTDAGPLLVRGRIDRLDTRKDVTIIRDLKTGRVHPRTGDAAEPDPEIDLQLALYTEVAKVSAAKWQLPPKFEAAYVHVDHLAMNNERAFNTDMDTLETAGKAWLSLSARILGERLFVRTTDPEHCRGCAFLPLCGSRAAQQSAAELTNTVGTLADFRDLIK